MSRGRAALGSFILLLSLVQLVIGNRAIVVRRRCQAASLQPCRHCLSSTVLRGDLNEAVSRTGTVHGHAVQGQYRGASRARCCMGTPHSNGLLRTCRFRALASKPLGSRPFCSALSMAAVACQQIAFRIGNLLRPIVTMVLSRELQRICSVNLQTSDWKRKCLPEQISHLKRLSPSMLR